MGKNNNTNEQALQEAQRYFEWFKGLDPVEPGDFVRRGVIRRIEGNPQEALEDFNLAEQQGYCSYTLFSERAKVNNTLQHYSQAIADVNIAMTMHKPTDTLLAERAFAQIHLGKYQQALTDLNRAIEMVLDLPDPEEKAFITYLLDERAKVHFHLRQFDKAAQDSRLAFAIMPTKERRSRKIEFEAAANKGSARWLKRRGYSVRIPEGKTFHPIDMPNHSRTTSGWQKRDGYSVKAPPDRKLTTVENHSVAIEPRPYYLNTHDGIALLIEDLSHKQESVRLLTVNILKKFLNEIIQNKPNSLKQQLVNKLYAVAATDSSQKVREAAVEALHQGSLNFLDNGDTLAYRAFCSSIRQTIEDKISANINSSNPFQLGFAGSLSTLTYKNQQYHVPDGIARIYSLACAAEDNVGQAQQNAEQISAILKEKQKQFSTPVAFFRCVSGRSRSKEVKEMYQEIKPLSVLMN